MKTNPQKTPEDDLPKQEPKSRGFASAAFDALGLTISVALIIMALLAIVSSRLMD